MGFGKSGENDQVRAGRDPAARGNPFRFSRPRRGQHGCGALAGWVLTPLLGLVPGSAMTAPSELVPEIVRQVLPDVASQMPPGAERAWPPVAVAKGSNIVAVGTQTHILFGTAVASFPAGPGGATSSRFAIGVPRVNGPGAPFRGAVISLALTSSNGWRLALEGMLDTPGQHGLFGQAVVPLGRIGRDDPRGLLVGAPTHRQGRSPVGALFLSLETGPWRGQAVSPILVGSQAFGRFASAIDSAGDVNGDGWCDVIIGARGEESESRRAGAAYVYLGSGDGIASQPVWSGRGAGFNTRYGSAVAGVGDVNGDGFDDILVGAPRHSSVQQDAGRVYLYLGSPDGPEPAPALAIDGAAGLGYFGEALCGIGDINGDGFDDVAIGAPGATREANNSMWAGEVRVFHGCIDGLESMPAVVLVGPHARSMFGATLAGRGDLNGDARTDLLVGAPSFTGARDSSGGVFLFPGSTGGIVSRPAWVLDGGQTGAQTGAALALVPDVDGDGCDELLVGSPYYSVVRVRAGRIDLLPGSRTAYTSTNLVPARPPETAPAVVLVPAPGSHRTNIILGAIALAAIVAGGGIWHQRRHEAQQAVASERKRVARDLHDDLGARLARISVLTDLMRREGGDTPDGRRLAEDLAATTREVLESMEEILWSVDPRNDTLEHLVNFIIQYCGPFFAPTGIAWTHEAPLELPDHVIPAVARKNLFLTVKEALNNVVKHAAATAAHVQISCIGSCLTIVIEDNGCGSASDSTPAVAGTTRRGHRRGHGLENMRARLAELGGECRIEPRPGGGTRVTLTCRV